MAERALFICPACGAKSRAGLWRCLRCGELQVPDAKKSRLRVWTRAHRSRLIAAGTLLSVVVTVALAAWRAVPTAGVPAPSASAHVATTSTAPATAPAAPVTPSMRSALDARRDGNVAYHAGDFERALKRYEEAVAANPSDPDSLNNLGQMLARNGRAAEAAKLFERAIAVNRNKWAYHFNLAHALGQLDDWKRAAAEYRSALDLFPDDYVTHYNLAQALHKSGDEESAVAEYRSAIALAPGEGTFYLSLAISLERLNRATEAAANYEKYLELTPMAPEAERMRKHVQQLRGQPAPAVASSLDTDR
jgi:Flp pilus assembly protein TadD